MLETLRKLMLAILLLLSAAGCTSLKEKCVKLDIGEGGNLNLTSPSTAWMAIELGSMTGTGPVKFESCPLLAPPQP